MPKPLDQMRYKLAAPDAVRAEAGTVVVPIASLHGAGALCILEMSPLETSALIANLCAARDAAEDHRAVLKLSGGMHDPHTGGTEGGE